MSLIRGVMLAGQFRTQHELNTMSPDGQRNTLIVEIAGRTKQTDLQSFNDFDLAGIGAVLVFLRTARIRSDADLKNMTADDMRNVAIVEIAAQTNLGSKLQDLRNMDLVLTALGVDPVFPPPPPPPPPLPSQLDFDFPNITFDNGVPVGGFMHLTLFQAGDFAFTGHFHDSGATEFNLNFVVGVRDSASPANLLIFSPAQGHVAGTFESGSRDYDWNILDHHPLIAQHWPTLAAGSSAMSKQSADSDFTSLANTLIGAVGLVLGVVGIVISIVLGGGTTKPEGEGPTPTPAQN